MGLSDWLKRNRPPSIWVVKQIDDALLHLCGKGTAEGEGSAATKLERIRAGRFSGAVRMQENDAVLNAGQFAALIPESDLTLIDDSEAQWQGRHWRIAWVPQRCWLHAGRLVTQLSDFHGQTRLVSVEDVSAIRAKAETPRRRDDYIPLEPIERPHRWRLRDKDDDGHDV